MRTVLFAATRTVLAQTADAASWSDGPPASLTPVELHRWLVHSGRGGYGRNARYGRYGRNARYGRNESPETVRFVQVQSREKKSNMSKYFFGVFIALARFSVHSLFQSIPEQKS